VVENREKYGTIKDMKVEDVKFHLVSDWQKPDCLFCDKPSVFEAVLHEGKIRSSVRCCEDKECRDKAIDFALIPFNGFGWPTETVH
jgi:hypothetical protein